MGQEGKRQCTIDVMVERLFEEERSVYECADHVKVDWCPCCGVNLRLYDENGNLFAKWIGANPSEARKLACGLLGMAYEMHCVAPDPTARAELHMQLLAACERAETDEATAEYRRDSDQLGRFLEACTVPEVGARVQSSVLHDVFNKWSRANALNEWKGKDFSDAITERGWKKDQSSVAFFLDLKLLETVGLGSI